MKTSETKFESYDAKGTNEYNSWESTIRSEPRNSAPLGRGTAIAVEGVL